MDEQRLKLSLGTGIVLLGGAFLLTGVSPPTEVQVDEGRFAPMQIIRALWPSLTALILVFLSRQTMASLLTGAVAGALILAGGNAWVATIDLFGEHFASIFRSEWYLAAIFFTLFLGGVAAVIEANGGLAKVLHGAMRRKLRPETGFQAGIAGLGLLCFFDGLANSLLIGRVGRGLADQSHVSRVKLAYLADSTSSAVACVAFISTWIAFQLSMIRDGLIDAGLAKTPYLWFLQSLPFNFYCWLSLAMLPVVILLRFHPGPMASYEAEALARPGMDATDSGPAPGSVVRALLPILAVLVLMLGGFYLYGVPAGMPGADYFPLSTEKVAAAFGSSAGALVLVLAGLGGSLVALVFGREGSLRETAGHYGRGMRALTAPLLILLAAWTLNGTINDLGAGQILANLVGDFLPIFALPALVFLAGAAVSFSTGTSWGTMALLMPLAIPLVALHPDFAGETTQGYLIAAVIGAVFSGAVFGDHCSPISDTTIVSSIGAGVEPIDHVRTQLPYALIVGTTALVLGFLPAGLGLPSWIGLAGGVVLFIALGISSARR